MSAARQHDHWTELWNEGRLLGDERLKRGDNQVAVARHVERGNGHHRAGKGSEQLPAPVDVAPPSERTVEAAPRKLLDINMMVMTSGRERTRSEFRNLLDGADLKVSRVIPTMAPQSIIEAIPK